MKASKKAVSWKGRLTKRCMTLFLAVLLCIPYLALTGCMSSDSSGGEVSETNVQERGVDEADIVKVNAKGEIYKAQRDGVTVSLMNKTDGTIEVVRKKAAQGVTPLEMFLYEDKYLIVINAKTNVGLFYYENSFSFSFTYDTMLVNVYDLEESTGGGIKLLRSDEFRGTYKTSRLTDGNMYLISNYQRDYGEAYVDYFEGASEFDVSYKDDSYYYGGYLIAKLNLNEAHGKYKTALYADKNVYDIYCSKYAFYTMKGDWFNNRRGWGCYSPNYYMDDGIYYDGQITDSIDRISLETLERTGTVSGFNGNSPNRFCLYDNGEYLFVANQRIFKRSESERDLGNWLYVFDADMKEVAALGPLAQGETMYSARYDGSVAYIVTAEQSFTTVDPITFEPRQVFVDPLFKIDISNPLEPVLTGELKIEGFSTYMQAFGDGLLLGLGRGADGTELKISMFDTSSDAPTEVNSLLMANGASEAETEARAILCEPDNNVFAFAARFDEGDMSEYGTLIFGVEDGELRRTAFLPEIDPNTDYSRKRTRRVVRIGGYLLTVSDGYIVSYLLSEALENGGADPVDIADTRIDTNETWCIVKFESDFGESYPDRIVEFNYFVTLPKPVDLTESRQFGHWASYHSEGSAYSNSRPVTGDMTLYAKWYKLPFRTVEFDINLPKGITSGTSDTGYQYLSNPPKQIVEDGGKLNVNYLHIGTLISGYKLTHWYKNVESVEYDFSAPVTASYTLYAYWKSVATHKVTFNYNYPDKSNSYSYPVIIEDGTRVSKPNGSNYYYSESGGKSTRFVIEYWFKDSNVPFDFNKAITGSITLKAKWKKAD